MSPPARKLRRALAAGLGLVVVLALAVSLTMRLYGASRLRAAKARFEDYGPLQLARYAPDAPAERYDNAALWLRAGSEGLLWTDAERELLDRRLGELGAPWSEVDRSAMAALLQSHAAAIDLLAKAAPLEGSSFEIEYALGTAVPIPNFLPLLQAGRLLAVESDYRLQEGDVAASLELVHLLERLTAVHRHESLVITLLLGASIERMYHDRLAAAIEHVSDEEALSRLEEDLEHLGSSSVPPLQPFTADCGVTFEAVRRYFAQPPDWSDASPSIVGPRWLLLRVFFAAGYDRLASALQLETCARTLDLLAQPLANEDPSRLLAETRPVSRLPFLAGFVDGFVPNFSDAASRDQATRSARALAAAALAARRARLKDGSYPDTLAALPTSPFSGETAVYEKLPDGSAEIAFPVAEESFRIRGGTVIPKVPPKLRWHLSP